MMANELQTQVTTLLDRIRGGDGDARERLVELVYEYLRGLASGLMHRERDGHTLQPTALVQVATGPELDAGDAACPRCGNLAKVAISH
jgi:hypothetical protein